MQVRGTDLLLDDHGPTARPEKTGSTIPELVAQPVQWLMPRKSGRPMNESCRTEYQMPVVR